MYKNKMPTSRILLVLAWLIFILGITIAGISIILNLSLLGLFRGLLIAMFAVLAAAALRMFANIGQLIFDLKVVQEQISCDSKDISQNIHQIKSFFERIEKHLALKK